MRGAETATPRSGPELTVVMPVYNEAGIIRTVVRLWCAELDRLGIDYELAVYDDGSSDGTADTLRELTQAHPRVRPHSHANAGHGPTILRGYREARGDWIFQVDSDHEIWPSDFEQLWRHRHQYDFLVGRRVEREGPVVRAVVSWAARTIVRVLFGGAVRDVNVPYRLIRREALKRLLVRMPDTAFAPNVIMSGLAARERLTTAEYPVRHHPRSAGATSLSAGRALAKGWRCFTETASVAFSRRQD